MTVKEIKNLTKFLTDKEIDKIREDIKSKETILKTQNVSEEEMGQVLNTLFAILVIEKTLESEIEGLEDIRDELEQELRESYEIYDNHMAKYKKQEKKKKKNWLLDFLFMSEEMRNKKEAIGSSNKEIAAMKKELSRLKGLTQTEQFRDMMMDRDGDAFKEFCNCPHECHNPHDNEHPLIDSLRDFARDREQFEHIRNGEMNSRVGEGRWYTSTVPLDDLMVTPPSKQNTGGIASERLRSPKHDEERTREVYKKNLMDYSTFVKKNNNTDNIVKNNMKKYMKK